MAIAFALTAKSIARTREWRRKTGPGLSALDIVQHGRCGEPRDDNEDESGAQFYSRASQGIEFAWRSPYLDCIFCNPYLVRNSLTRGIGRSQS